MIKYIYTLCPVESCKSETLKRTFADDSLVDESIVKSAFNAFPMHIDGNKVYLHGKCSACIAYENLMLNVHQIIFNVENDRTLLPDQDK